MQVSDLVKVQLLLNGEPVDALSLITHSSRAYPKGKALCQKLKETIPRCAGWPFLSDCSPPIRLHPPLVLAACNRFYLLAGRHPLDIACLQATV